MNLLGYCLGGTLTATGLAYLAARDKGRANTGTMIATMTDFEDQGDFAVFVSNESVKALREQLADKGYLDEAELSRLFSLLRANDLIWSSAISSYLLADEPARPPTSSSGSRTGSGCPPRCSTPSWTR